MKPISFRHRYHKLNVAAGGTFTTIRGAAMIKRLHPGNRVRVETPDGDFDAEVVALEFRRVSEMPIAFLKADAEYPGFVISSHADFVNLLNSFRAPAWKKVALDSELTVITLRKL